jgi:hypothetical protein
MSYANPTSEDRFCNVCGWLAETHPRCAQCGIFVGAGHADTALVDGAHCFTCRRLLKRWEAAEARIRDGREARHAATRWQGGQA